MSIEEKIKRAAVEKLKKLFKQLRLIKKIAGHEARLELARQEIAERWNGTPPYDVERRIECIDKMMPDSHKRETSREIAVLLGEVEGRLMVDYAVSGEKSLRGASEGGDERNKEYQVTRLLYQSEVDRLHKANSNLSWEDIKKLTAAKFNVCSKTIYRHATNPKKK